MNKVLKQKTFKNKYFEICALIFLLIVLLSLNIILFNRSKMIREVYSKVEITSKYEDIAQVSTPYTVPLKITNIQMYNANKEYTYKIKINSDLSTIKYKINNQEETINLDENKEFIISIKPNDNILIEEIPINTEYTITQIDSGNVIINDNQTNTYTDITKLNNEVLFYNSEDQTLNPDSSDSIIIFLYLFIILLLTLIILRRLKINKYNN